MCSLNSISHKYLIYHGFNVKKCFEEYPKKILLTFRQSCCCVYDTDYKLKFKNISTKECKCINELDGLVNDRICRLNKSLPL